MSMTRLRSESAADERAAKARELSTRALKAASTRVDGFTDKSAAEGQVWLSSRIQK